MPVFQLLYLITKSLFLCMLQNIERHSGARDDSVCVGNILYRILVKLRKQAEQDQAIAVVKSVLFTVHRSPYLHLFYLKTLHEILHAHLLRYTPAAHRRIKYAADEEKESHIKTMYILCVCAENTRDKRKTIENNKEQPLKQHAEPVYRRMPTVTLKLFSCAQLRTQNKRRECKPCSRMPFIRSGNVISAFGFRQMHMGSESKRALRMHIPSIYC